MIGYCFIAGYLMLKNSRYTTLSCRNNAIIYSAVIIIIIHRVARQTL